MITLYRNNFSKMDFKKNLQIVITKLKVGRKKLLKEAPV